MKKADEHARPRGKTLLGSPCGKLRLYRKLAAWMVASAMLAIAIVGSFRSSALDLSLEVSFPADLDWGVLDIGENRSGMQVISVQSDVGYKVYARADRDRLSQWDQRYMSYVAGKEMTEPLLLVSERGTFAVGMTDILIADRSSSSQSETVSFWFVQRVGFDDTPAPLNRVYRILLTYTVVQDV